ncbi:hypothetical protein UFOVP642_8 [uncultured Caudovirales phage]|uniref:Uncharacterized protein n=1 Tax=uncultured Caudovirales phage TaxID=2100421 RepID=A0A6J5N7S0_9CAUD|nr:hypothetical protein UFOVP642_8 [uncultured Caudovirales phage]
MAAGQLNILIEQGATFSRILTVETTPSVPLNLTGYTFAGKLKRSFTDANAAATFGIAVTNAALGQATWTLTPVQTQSLPPQVLRYDIEMTQTSSGTVTRLLEGEAWVSASMTN